MKFVIEMDKSK